MNTARKYIAMIVWIVGTLICVSANASVGPESDPSNVYWSDQFKVLGINGTVNVTVNAIARDRRSEKIYVGGSFPKVGAMPASNIAVWDGTKLTPLPTGPNGTVNALAVDSSSGNLYVGGNFTKAGGVTVNNIAMWNGTSWFALGLTPGTNGPVYALAVDEIYSHVYVGGSFASVGGITANNIAMWNGFSWSALGVTPGTNWEVNALALDTSDNLYAGGQFTTAGGVAVNGIAMWNGSSWSAMGTTPGMDGTISALATDIFDNVYAGGYFGTAGGVAAKNIAMWNGTSWSALGAGISNSVRALAVDYSGNLCAGGSFYTAGGVTVNNVAKWNGTSWSALGATSGTNDVVEALATDNSNNLYVGGHFMTAGNVACNYFARWNGYLWSAMGLEAGTNVNGRVSAIAFDHSGRTYAAGSFTAVDGVTANGVATSDGTAWSAMGSGISGIYTLALDSSDNVYAGGYFNYIAKWSGTSWSQLGMGLGGSSPSVNAIAADSSGNLYAGGYFTTAGGVTVNNIAKWNGTSWSALGTGTSGAVDAIAFDGSGNLYAGGFFTTAGGVTVNNIAKWNGTSWSALGTGTSSTVCTLALDGSGNLYAGGGFTTAGGITVNNIGKWNGTSWSALGTGTNSQVNALLVGSSNTLYAGGLFTTAGGVTVNYIGKWNGTSWSALGTGMGGCVSPCVTALASDALGNVYAGGQFVMNACGVTVNNMAKWNGTSWSASEALPATFGASGAANALAVHGSGNLYVGGSFVAAGGVPVDNVGRFDGTTWAALGSGFGGSIGVVETLALDGSGNLYAAELLTGAAKWNGTSWSALGGRIEDIYALTADNSGNVYAGGAFTMVGTLTVNNVAKWNGTSWGALGTGMTSSPGYEATVYALAADSSGNVYAGGSFMTAGGVTVNRIAKWNGTTWSALGVTPGISSGYVKAVALDGSGNLYVGGSFITADGITVNNIAKWNGTSWSALGSGTNGIVKAVAVDGLGNVYAGGTFTTAGGVTVNNVARWNGTSWSVLGTGTDGEVDTLAVYRNVLFAGGQFATAGNKVSAYVAEWEPRVNESEGSLAASPGTLSIGNDVYGFYKPSLRTFLGTTVSYSLGLPVTATLNRADEIRVAGNRVNGAFTIGPTGLQFGGTGATLTVELSDDDAAAYGVPYTQFRAFQITYPTDYPASMEAATLTSIGSAMPVPVRVQNGKQIYGITVPVSQTGGTYGAVPAPPDNPPSNPDSTAIGLNTITWTWQDNSSNETGFKLYDDPGAGPPASLRTTTAAQIESWQHNGLSTNSQYAFEVCATDGGVNSARTPNYVAWTLIEPVAGLGFTSVTATSILVGVTNTPSNLMSGTSGLYLANITAGTNSGWVQTTAPWDSIGLTPNTLYTFSGKSRNGASVGTAPVAGSQRTLAAVPVAPSVTLPVPHMAALHALDVSIGSGDGNPPATTYAIQMLPGVSGNIWVHADGTTGSNALYQTASMWGTTRVAGLAEATSYTFAVTARNADSIDAGPGATTVVNTPTNTPPTAPSVTFPSTSDGTTDLTCSASSTDEDGDPILYDFTWHYLRAGTYTFAHATGFTPASQDSISPVQLQPGDVWYCDITPSDGDMTGTKASVICMIKYRSQITLMFTPTSYTLGQPVTFSGQVSGAGGIPQDLSSITFQIVSPSGPGTFPLSGSWSPDGTYFQPSYYPTEAGAWLVKASWGGDNIYLPASSPQLPLSVAEAQPSLSLTLSRSAALVNLMDAPTFHADVTFSVPQWPSDLQSLLANKTIRLSVRKPDGTTPFAPLTTTTDAYSVATFTAWPFLAAGMFQETGLWKFKAEFVQDNNFKAAATDDWSVTTAALAIKEAAGYAVIALGQLDQNAEGRANHLQTTDYVRLVLLERGFTSDDIYYLRDQDDSDAQKRPSPANLEYAIETWAPQKMNTSPAPLYVILVNHGGPGTFYMATPGVNGQVSTSDLSSWLTLLESQLNPGALDEDIFLIDGSCYAGSMIPALSGAHRVLITSASRDEISYRGVENDETDLRDGDFFLMELFRNLGTGMFVRNAFEEASTKAYEYTQYRSGGIVVLPQHPLLDDNADGEGSSAPLAVASTGDGARTAAMTLGLGSNAGNGISWFTVEPSKTINPGGDIGTLVAETTGRSWIAGVDEAWLEIKTPNYISKLASEQYPQYQRVAQMAGPVPAPTPESLGGGKYRFTWTMANLMPVHLPLGFDTPGTYKVYYFLRDGQTHQVGAYLVTNIYVSAGTGNHAPGPVTLLYPDNGFIVPPGVILAWTATTDPDHDPITYRVELSEDSGFPPASTIVTEVSETLLCTSDIPSLVTGNTYYWRVIPYDPYGAHPAVNTEWHFTLQGNPQNIGCIDGQAYIKGTQCTQFPVASPGVTLYDNLGVAVSFGTGDLGTPFMRQTGNRYILGNLPQAENYRLGVTATGFHAATVTGVTVASKLTTRQDACLEPTSTGSCSILGPAGPVRVGQQAILAFQAAGMTPEWQYEWFRDGELLQGEIGPTLTIESAVLGDKGEYTCTAISDIGGVYTASYNLDVVEYSLAGPGLALLGALSVFLTLHGVHRTRKR